MAAEDNGSSYAPKSPDLSSFYSSGPTQPASQIAVPRHPLAPASAPPLPHHHSPHHHSPHHHPSHRPPPRQPAPPTSSPLHAHAPDPGRGRYTPSAYRSISAYPPSVSPVVKPECRSYSTSAHQQYLPPSAPRQSPSPSRPPPYGLQSPTLHRPTLYQPRQQHPAYLQAQAQAQPPPPPPPQQQQQQQQHQPWDAASVSEPEPEPEPEPAPAPAQPPSDMPPRRAAAAPPPAAEPSPVRTKFPTARIKRIMQADEEVGKVAQQTPIAVGKALELFMIQLVTKSADVAKEKGSKRVTAPMLKQVVETDDQWDFLRDIVSRVENDKEGSRAKAKTEESESDDDFVEPRKRGRGGGRRKKA